MNVISSTANFIDFDVADMALADWGRYAVLGGGFNGH